MSSFESYEKAVRSGRHKPYVHPESAFADQDERLSNSPDIPPKANKKEWALLVLAILLALVTGYVLRNPNPKAFVNEKIEQIESIVMQPSEPSYKDTQRIALEKIAMLERIAMQALRDYNYAVRNNLYHPGVCFGLDGVMDCRKAIERSKEVQSRLP